MSLTDARRAARDGQWYSRSDFIEHYGGQCGERMWAMATPAPIESNVRRLTQQFNSLGSPSVQPTDRSSFDGRHIQGNNTDALYRRTVQSGDVPQPTEPTANDSQQGNQHSVDLNSGVVQPAARSGDVSQRSHSAASDSFRDVPQPGNQAADQSNIAVIQLIDIAYTGQGGKHAGNKQRELRTRLLDRGEYEHDLTRGAWDWKSVIGAQLPDVQKLLVGSGIVKFSFKLLSGVTDANYMTRDAGYRHVFEIKRVDGSCYHLHFHKDGKHDSPSCFPCPAAVNDSRATQPDAKPYQRHHIDYTNDITVVNSAVETPVIGRNETVLALSLMVGAVLALSPDDTAVDIAIDITDGQSFNWRRWLQNKLSQEIVNDGLAKVFVVRQKSDKETYIACCRTDKTYTMNIVRGGKHKLCTPPSQDDWTTNAIFKSPWFIPYDWMMLHENHNVQSTVPQPLC